jgi:hypothetical protein
MSILSAGSLYLVALSAQVPDALISTAVDDDARAIYSRPAENSGDKEFIGDAGTVMGHPARYPA